MLISDYNKSNI